MKLDFFDATKLDSMKNETNKIIKELLEMDEDKACKVTGKYSRLNTLTQRLYSEHKGVFYISHKFDHIIVAKK